LGSFKIAIDGLLITIFLGYLFVVLQGFEYYEANFSLSDGIFANTFFMLTGLHGCHVIVGATFLFICFIRLINRHFLTKHYLGLVCAI
jgi:heme/copper-type cytochrome/quinol oxidase subunit 3